MLTIMFFVNNFKHPLLLSGDIEVNPGPKRSSNIKFCHWNLNGLAAHDFIKVPLIEAFITTSNIDIVSQPTFQRRINIVLTLCVNVEITLIRR